MQDIKKEVEFYINLIQTSKNAIKIASETTDRTDADRSYSKGVLDGLGLGEKMLENILQSIEWLNK
jgi:hypothetical protein